jgi:hypothetical protein
MTQVNYFARVRMKLAVLITMRIIQIQPSIMVQTVLQVLHKHTLSDKEKEIVILIVTVKAA